MTSTPLAPPARGAAGPPAASRRASVLRRRRARAGWLLVAPATLLLVAFFLVPLVLSIVMSFSDWPILGDPTPAGVSNYTRILEDDIVRRSIGFTLLYTVLITAVTFVLSFGLAVLLQRGGRYVRALRTAIFIPSAVGFGLAALLWGTLYNAQIGVFSALLQAVGLASGPVLFFDSQATSLLSVIVMVAWKSVGLDMLVMLVGLQSIPFELYEAARVDGASRWQQMRFITLPLMRPTFVLLLVLGVSAAFLSFDQFFILTNGGPDQSTITIVYAIYRAAFTQFQLGYAAAIGVALMVVLVVLNVGVLRFLRPRAEV